MTLFYSHLIEMDFIIETLDKIDLSKEERMHLAALVDSSLHHTVLDAIFSQLNDQDKRVLMQHITSEDHIKIWEYLNRKVVNAEEIIIKAAEDLKKQLHKDLKKAKGVK